MYTTPFSWARFQHDNAARTCRIGRRRMQRLSLSRKDIFRRWPRCVEGSVPAPARNRWQRRIHRLLRHVEDHVQVFFLWRYPRDSEGQDARILVIPGRLADPRAVPGDVRNPAAADRLAIEEAVEHEARMAAAQRNQLAREA